MVTSGKNEESMYVLVFFGRVYQSRQMKIQARVGEQYQLGQKRLVVPSGVTRVDPVWGKGITVPRLLVTGGCLAARTGLQDTLELDRDVLSRKLSRHTRILSIIPTKRFTARKKFC